MVFNISYKGVLVAQCVRLPIGPVDIGLISTAAYVLKGWVCTAYPSPIKDTSLLHTSRKSRHSL